MRFRTSRSSGVMVKNYFRIIINLNRISAQRKMNRQRAKISRGLQELHPCHLLPTLAAALVSGAVGIMISVSFVTLIFGGELNHLVPAGGGIVLFSMIALRVVTALLSSFPGIIADVDAFPSAILGIIVASISNSMPTGTTSSETFLTIAFAIALTSVFTGLFLFLLGQFRVGELIRLVPYPVIGGFLAGTGWLLVDGAIFVMTDMPINIAHMSSLFGAKTILQWFPGVIFAILLLGLFRRWNHSMILPISIGSAIGLFYILLVLTGTTLTEARAEGWLLGPFPEKELWQPLSFENLTQVNWSVILDQSTNIVTIMGFSAPSVLLAAGGLELVTARHIRLNRELKAAGIANIVSGLGGGMVGYHTVSDSTLAYRMGARSRLVGLFTAGLCAIVLIDGASILSLFPKPVLGGLLLFLGFSFLADWLYDAWVKLSKPDYFLVLLILIIISTVGFLQGIGVGFLVAIIIFVFEYSRKSAVRYTDSGADRRSHIFKSEQQNQYFSERGDQIYIIGLGEFLFFGTSNSLLDRIRQRLYDPHRLRLKFIVFDFKNVIGIDSSTVRSFIKIKQIAAQNQIKLFFIGIEPTVFIRLERGGCIEINDPICHIFPTINQGLVWVGEQILRQDQAEGRKFAN